MGDVPFTDAAVIILYAGMLGAGDSFSMITTSLLSMAIGFLGIPVSWLTMKIGNCQKTIMIVTSLALIMFAFIVMAPFFGHWGLYVLIISLMLYAVTHAVYVSAWFPLLDTFIRDERRNAYLGKMRFSWQLTSAVLLFAIGLIIGKNPPISMIQGVMLFSVAFFACKIYFIGHVPCFIIPGGKEKKMEYDYRKGLRTALENKPLTGYSAYLFILNLAAYGTIPLASLYLKKALQAPDNVIVFVSSVTLAGMLTGSLFAGLIIKRWGIRKTFLFVHVFYAITNLALFFMSRGIMPDLLLYGSIAGILFVYSFVFACANISSSSEMMALATPGNKVMAMAFCNAFYYSGCGLSRFLSSLLIGSGMLAPFWNLGGLAITHYQTMFLLYTICVAFAASLLVVVPAIFPKGEYIYAIHN